MVVKSKYPSFKLHEAATNLEYVKRTKECPDCGGIMGWTTIIFLDEDWENKTWWYCEDCKERKLLKYVIE